MQLVKLCQLLGLPNVVCVLFFCLFVFICLFPFKRLEAKRMQLVKLCQLLGLPNVVYFCLLVFVCLFFVCKFLVCLFLVCLFPLKRLVAKRMQLVKLCQLLGLPNWLIHFTHAHNTGLARIWVFRNNWKIAFNQFCIVRSMQKPCKFLGKKVLKLVPIHAGRSYHSEKLWHPLWKCESITYRLTESQEHFRIKNLASKCAARFKVVPVLTISAKQSYLGGTEKPSSAVVVFNWMSSSAKGSVQSY